MNLGQPFTVNSCWWILTGDITWENDFVSTLKQRRFGLSMTEFLSQKVGVTGNQLSSETNIIIK